SRHEQFRESAILLSLIEVGVETYLLFEVRSMNLRSQPGDICFPGGKVDKDDKNQRQTAIRETSEELRISEADIYDVIPLVCMVSDFGRIIYTFIGRINKIKQIT